MSNIPPGYDIPEDIEPILEDISGHTFYCEFEGCDCHATTYLKWPMEDHDYPCGFYCDKHLEQVLDA
jgi:hypothetical protein